MTAETAAGPDAAAMCECGREMYRHGARTVNGGWKFSCERLAEIDAWCARGERPPWWQQAWQAAAQAWQLVHRKPRQQ